VRPTDAEVACVACGAEYDVFIHGSKSPEVALGAKKYPTRAHCSLRPTPTRPETEPYPPGTVLYVGTKISIRIGVYSPDEGKYISPRPSNVLIFRKINDEPWERIWAGSWVIGAQYLGFELFDVAYTIDRPGTHTFYSEFQGTDIYQGCGSEIHALEVSDYSVSPEVSITATPALTVIVKDAVTKKLIEGAHVLVDTYEAFTDAEGKAVFEVVPPGTYTLWAEARNYKPVTFKPKITLTEAGMVFEIALWPIWSVALTAVGGTSVVLVGTAKAMRWI